MAVPKRSVRGEEMERLLEPRRETEPAMVRREEEGQKEDPRVATDERSPAMLVVSELFGPIAGRGTDCRLDLGSAHRSKVWPREAIHPGRWRWTLSQEYGWKVSGHINELELEAVVLAVKRRMRQRRAVGTRFLHLTVTGGRRDNGEGTELIEETESETHGTGGVVAWYAQCGSGWMGEDRRESG